MTHDFDRNLAQALLDQLTANLPYFVRNARRSTANLPTLVSAGFRLAALHRGLGSPLAASRAALRLGVDAGLGVFLCAASPGQTVSFRLGDEDVTATADITPDQAHGGRWERTFHGASVLGDERTVSALCALPLEIPLSSSTTPLSHLVPWLKALHELGGTGHVNQDLLLEAMRATDPGKLPADAADTVLYLDVPAIDVLHQIGHRDQAGLTQALRTGVDEHRRFWAAPGRTNREDGLVSWPLSGLARVARAHGLKVEVTSAYLLDLGAA